MIAKFDDRACTIRGKLNLLGAIRVNARGSPGKFNFSHSLSLFLVRARARTHETPPHTTDYTSSKSTIPGSQVAIVGQIYPLIHGFSRP